MNRLNFERYASDGKKYYIADLVWNNGGKILNHSHDFYEIFIVLQGQFEECSNGKNITVRRRRLHIIGPSDYHGLSAQTYKEPVILRNIAIHKEQFENTLKRLGISPEDVCGHYIVDENFFAEFKKKTDMIYGPYPDGDIFNFLMQNILEDILTTAVLQRGNEHGIPNWLKKAYREMEQDDNAAKGLSKLLELTGKSQEYLTRSFQKYYHITPTEYINILRLSNASKLLQTTDEKIIDIAYICGFNSISYFNRLFKSHYGMTPRDYREYENWTFMSI